MKPRYVTYGVDRWQDIRLRPGEVTILRYYHDDDCPKLKGRDCNCDPDMEVTEVHDHDGGG
jgi:hypothetical protein